ncbi:MAG: hypothetical protein UEP57_08230 [Oscillospiraceae bacterium]|nr:hypothetical protein [Oscillospiraceae bacterium]
MGVDLCHVRPYDFGKVFVVPLADTGLEHGDDRRRVDFSMGGGSPGDNVRQFRLSDPQPIQFGFQFRHDQAGQHGLHAVRDLPVDLGQFGFLSGQIRSRAVDPVGDHLGRFREVHRPQVFLQVLHDERFDFVGVYILCPAGMRPVLIAAAIVPGRIPFFVCAGVADVSGAALFAMDQARQQVSVAGFISSGAFVVLHSGLHLLPCVVVYDPGDRALYAFHVGIQLPACPLPHDLVFFLVPGIDAYVSFILQHTVQRVLADRSAAFTQGAVQVVYDVVVTFPGSIPPKDVPDDPGLCRIDRVLAVDDVVAQGRDATQEGPLLRLYGDAVDGLLPGAQDFNLAYAHGDQFRQKVCAVCEVAQLLTAGADHLNTQVHHCFSESEPVADVTAAAADVVNDHRPELLPVRSCHQSLETFPVCVGAAGRFILEAGDDLNVIFCGVLPDLRLLVRYAVFGLVVGGVPHILSRGQRPVYG